MNATEEAAAAAPTTSVRYERLLQVLRKALERSKQELNVPELIRACYGSDASILEGSDSDVLPRLVGHLLDKVNARVQEDAIRRILPEHGVEESLLRLESAARRVRAADAEERRRRDAARDRARTASQAAKLPPGTAPSDWVAIESYRALRREHDELRVRVDAAEREVEKLRRARAELSHAAQSRVRDLQQAAREAERAADLCSMMS